MNLLQLLATGAPPPPTYIEDVFSAYTYTGDDNQRNIINGIALSTSGGLVWTKSRTSTHDNVLFDTVRGAEQRLSANLTAAEDNRPNAVSAFLTTGYTVKSD